MDGGSYSHDAYLTTSRVPGMSLSECQDILSEKDGADFVTQMQGYVAQIRSIPKIINPEYDICNTLGEACRDPRIRDAESAGPFVDEVAFSQVLRNPDDPSRRGHKILFTHADLNTRNMLGDRVIWPDGTSAWKVTGIVDWENSTTTWNIGTTPRRCSRDSDTLCGGVSSCTIYSNRLGISQRSLKSKREAGRKVIIYDKP